MRLPGKIAIVTGAGSGIGRAIALAFVAAGARVLINDRDPETGAETVKLCERASGPGLAELVAGDVGDKTTWVTLCERSQSRYGGLDVLVNNAAYVSMTTALETSEADWDRHITVSLKSLYWSAQHCLPLLIERGGGSIVNIASVHAHVGFKNSCAYDVCKHGVIGFTKSLATDYAHFKIRCNSLSPGVINTAPLREADESLMQRLADASLAGRVGDPEEVAHAALFLASDEASFITGTDLLIDGGLTAFKTW